MPRRPGSLPPELAVRKTTAPITLLLRKGDPLCAQAKRLVEHSARRYKLAVEEVDIEREPAEIQERFRHDVPVVLIDGKRRFSGHFSQALLERALQSRRT